MIYYRSNGRFIIIGLSVEITNPGHWRFLLDHDNMNYMKQNNGSTSNFIIAHHIKKASTCQKNRKSERFLLNRYPLHKKALFTTGSQPIQYQPQPKASSPLIWITSAKLPVNFTATSQKYHFNRQKGADGERSIIGRVHNWKMKPGKQVYLHRSRFSLFNGLLS